MLSKMRYPYNFLPLLGRLGGVGLFGRCTFLDAFDLLLVTAALKGAKFDSSFILFLNVFLRLDTKKTFISKDQLKLEHGGPKRAKKWEHIKA